jgi:hypothetical protein
MEPIAMLYRNEMTPNALEVCFNVIILNISSELVPFDDFILNCFGAEDEFHMDIRDPETIINTLRLEHNALFCQLCDRAYTIGRLIFQQFSELGTPIVHEEQIRTILNEFGMVFQHFYPNKFISDEFIKAIKKIPFYENNAIVKQETIRFILTAASIFCTIEHANQFRALLEPLQ